MLLEEFMTRHGITTWDSRRISRRGNHVLTAAKVVRYEYDGYGEAQTYFCRVVVNSQTHTIVDQGIVVTDSWTY